MQHTIFLLSLLIRACVNSILFHSETTAVPTTEHQALLLKVQQLEEQIVQNQKAFEQQLQQQKQASPRAGAAVVTSTGKFFLWLTLFSPIVLFHDIEVAIIVVVK